VIHRPFVLIAAAGAILTFSGCSNKEKQARHDAMVEFMHGNTPDPDMAAAIAKSQATLKDFLAALQHPKPGQTNFLVRAIFPAEKGKQQILWINSLTFDGEKLHGKADDNTAKQGSGIPKDGAATVELSKVADWMYQEGNKAVGGWTLRVLKKKFPEETNELPTLRDMQFQD
jgi:uncharacterized protein YegJ (DUF2314 family)